MSRRHGAVGSAAGLVPFGHLGWGYRDRSEFLERAGEYMADGLARHQWVEFVGSGTREGLRAELAAIPGDLDLSDVKVTPALEFYGVTTGDIVDPAVAIDTRVAAVENAISLGYSGFRAVVDATSVSSRPDQREAFSRFEFLIDQQMAVLPVSALCAYDLNELADDAAGLVCLHPLVDPAAPTFRIYSEPGAAFKLDGEIDTANGQIFMHALRGIWPQVPEGEIRIDASDLEFIGHQHLVALDNLASGDGRQVLFCAAQPILIRLVNLLGLTNVRVQPS